MPETPPCSAVRNASRPIPFGATTPMPEMTTSLTVIGLRAPIRQGLGRPRLYAAGSAGLCARAGIQTRRRRERPLLWMSNVRTGTRCRAAFLEEGDRSSTDLDE